MVGLTYSNTDDEKDGDSIDVRAQDPIAQTTSEEVSQVCKQIHMPPPGVRIQIQN